MSAERSLPAVRLPYDHAALSAYKVDEGQWKVLIDAVFPTARSPQSIVMALGYCRARNLDIFKKPVHIVPMWSSEKRDYIETVWPGISEIRTTAFRTGQYAGIESATFGPDTEQKFEGSTKSGRREVTVRFPEWAQIVVHRVLDGQLRSFAGPKVYWLESYARVGNTDLPNDMWAKRPRGQLEKVAEAAALRRAFPEEIGNDYSAEEMEGQRLLDPADVARDVTPTLAEPPAPPPSLEKPPIVQQRQIIHERQQEQPRSTQAYSEMGRQAAPVQSAPVDPDKYDNLVADLEAELLRATTNDHVTATVENFRLEISQAPEDYRTIANDLVKENRERVRALEAKAAETAAAAPVAESTAAAAPDTSSADGGAPTAGGEAEGPEQTGPTPPPPPPEDPPAPPADEAPRTHLDELLEAARLKAMEGRKKLNFFFAKLQAEDRDLIRPHDKDLYAAAEVADTNAAKMEGAQS